MKKRKKILVRLLTAVLCVSLLPVTVMAAPDEGDPGNGTVLEAWPEGSDNPGSGSITYQVDPGDTKTIRVSVNSATPNDLVYKWSRTTYDRSVEGNWKLEDLNADTAEITTDPINMMTYYNCTVKDPVTNEESTASFHFEIDNHLTLNFLDSESGESKDFPVTKGDTATIEVEVSADDDADLEYHWEWNGVPVSEATGNVFTTPEVTEPSTAFCYVYDKYGVSRAVTAHVYPDNHLTASALEYEGDDPLYAVYSVELGGSKTLGVSATASDPSGLSYHWTGEVLYSDGWTEIDLSGIDTAEYTLENITHSLRYTCEVYDALAQRSVYVSFVVLVDNGLQLVIEGYEELGGYFSDTVKQGESKTYKMVPTADDPGEFTYEWFINNELVGTDASYEVSNVSGVFELCGYVNDLKYGNRAGITIEISPYSCFSAWADGSEGQEDTLSLYVEENNTTTLAVAVSADDGVEVSYQWYMAGMNDETLSEISGATGSSIETFAVTEVAQYSCRVYDDVSGQEKWITFFVFLDNEFEAYGKDTDTDWVFVYVDRDETAELEVEVSGLDTEGVTYQWYLETADPEEPIEDATGSSITTQPIEGPVTYRCDLRDRFGNPATVHFVVTIQNNFAAWISDEYEGCTDTTIYLDMNESTTLSVTVSADKTEGLSYTWEMKDPAEDESTLIDGVSGSEYTVTMTGKRTLYFCTVFDPVCGESRFITFDVRVNNDFGLKIAGYDSDYACIGVPYGTTKELSVEVSAREKAGITYEWFVGDDQMENDSDTFVSPEITEETYITCYVTDKYGTTLSVVFDLEPETEFGAWIAGKDEYDSYDNYTVVPGGFLTLAADTDWDDSLTYKWYIEEVESFIPYRTQYGERKVISGETGDSIVAGPIEKSCMITCVITNEWGCEQVVTYDIEVENNFAAWVTGTGDENNGKMDITYHPDTLGEDKLLSVTCRATEKSGIKYAWYKHSPDSTFEKISGANGNEYTARDIRKAEAYFCVVTDKYMNITVVVFGFEIDSDFKAWATASGELKMDEWYFFSETSEDQILSVSTNTQDVTYAWYTCEAEEFDWDKRVLCADSENSPQYTVKPAEANRVYWCLVVDPLGHSTWIIFERFDDVVAWAPEEDGSFGSTCTYLSIPRGGSTVLEVLTDSASGEGCTFKWYKCSQNEDEEDTLLGETSNRLTVDDILGSEVYKCEVTFVGYYSSEEDSEPEPKTESVYFEITCIGAWAAGSEDHDTYSSQVVNAGDSVSLAVDVDASISGPEYQWYYYGRTEGDTYDYTLIEGATSDHFEIDNVVARTNPYCKITDELGNEFWVEFMIYVDDSNVDPVQLRASGLTLDGYLKIRFQFALPEQFVTTEGSYLMINNTKYFVSDATKDSDGYYIFTYSVTSSQTRIPIILRAYYPGGELYPFITLSGIDHKDGYVYSMTQYVAVVSAMSNEQLSEYTDKPDALKLLLKRLNEYGTLSQAYFKHNHSSGTISSSELDEVNEVEISDLETDFAPSIYQVPANGLLYQMSLSLKTDTHINHVFTLYGGRSIDEYQFFVGDTEITTQSKGNIRLIKDSEDTYYLKIANISASNLDTPYDVKVVLRSTGEEVIRVQNYSALSYAYLYLERFENDPSRAELVKTLKCLYLYNQAANDFFGN